MSAALLVAQLTTAFISHHVTVRFVDAQRAHVHEELSYDAAHVEDEGPALKTLVRELEPTMTVKHRRGRRDIVHLVSDGEVTDETGLGLSLDVPLYTEREHDVRVRVEWPTHLDLHYRVTSGAQPVLETIGGRSVYSFTMPIGTFCARNAPPEDAAPHLGLSAVRSWQTIADAWRDPVNALPARLRRDAVAHAADPVVWIRRWLAERAPRRVYRVPDTRRSLVEALASNAISKGEALRLTVALLEAMGRDATVVYAGDPLQVRLDPDVPDARIEPVLVMSGGWLDLDAPNGLPLKRWQQGLKVFLIRRTGFSFHQIGVQPAALRVETDVAAHSVRERQHRTGFMYFGGFDAWLPDAAQQAIGAEAVQELHITLTRDALDADYVAVGVVKVHGSELQIPISQWLTRSAQQTANDIFAADEGPIAIVPLELVGVTRFEIPPGMQLFGLSNASDTSNVIDWEQRVEAHGRHVTVTRRLSFHARRLGMGDVGAARAMLKAWANLPESAHLVQLNRN